MCSASKVATLCQNILKRVNQPSKTCITINYFKIKCFVACILANFTFQISLPRTLKA